MNGLESGGTSPSGSGFRGGPAARFGSGLLDEVGGEVSGETGSEGTAHAAVDVLVIGGGIAGATLHYYLARSGVDSLLVDAGAEGASGASSVPAALLNPNRGRSGRSSLADQEGLAAFWRLVAELEAAGHEPGATRSGVLRVADNPRQARAWRRLPDTTWLEPGAVDPVYHAPFGAMLVERGGWVRPALLLGALEAGAAAAGGRTRRGIDVGGLSETVTGVSATIDGGAIVARKAVLCTGAATRPGLRQPAFETVWGEALVLSAPVAAPYPLAGAVVAAFGPVGPAGMAEVYVTGGHSAAPAPAWPDEQWSGPAPEGDGGAEGDGVAGVARPPHPLVSALAWQVPGVAGARVVRRWVGARAKRPSGEPVARRLTRNVHVLGALGGRGFLRAATLAEALGRRLVEELAR